MRKTLKLVKEISIIVLLIAACTIKLQAQTYPVQVNAQITPPFSPYLTDYTEVGAQRFMVNFLLKDPTLPEYRCKLRLTIEGVGITIRTKPGFVPQPLVLPGGGIPLQLYGEDLQEYFNPNNLDFAGITRSQYAKGAKLPDGVYRFTIEVLDYNRGSVVSNKGTTVAWIILNDPPLLNMPRTDTKIKILDPTNIPFTWTPRHTGSPNSAFTTEYIFRLVEIWPATRNAYDAFLSQQPLYEITTNSTQVVYGPAEPALIPGRKYAWQVQAKDVEGRDLFKNQGKSEVFVFQFGDALGAPEGLYLQTANPTSLVVRWEQNVAGTDAVKYRVRYRPHNDRDHENWYEEESEEQWKALPQLQPNTEYEVQVRAEQSTQVSEYSPVKVFKTALPGANEFVCKSDVTPPPAPATNAPAFRLGVNDTIHAGGYDVLVRELTANANGVYTGSGMAIVPWFMHAKVRVTFKNINVNTQHWLTSGEIKSVWNPDSKFLATPGKGKESSTNSGNGKGDTPAETKTLIEIKDKIIVDVTKNEDGDIEIHTSDGETTKLDKGQSYSIVDEAGNGYIVDKEGDITKTTAQAARDAAGRGDRNYTITLRFEKGKAVFGFDEKKYDALASNYQQLEDGPFIAWKAVSSKADVVNAVLDGTDIDPKKVRFEVNGAPVSHTGFGNGPSVVTVQGKGEGTVEELLAVYAPSDTGKVNVLGKLNMVSYDQISRNLVIVPVNNAKLPGNLSDVTLTQELTKIFGQAVADWKVSIAPTPLKVTLDEYFDDGESGLLSNYTADMKKVINAFGNLQEKTYYLFLVEKPRSGKSALGYMPRSKQAGFIFSDNLTSTNAIPTIAHELGHGAFNLKHIFSEYSFSKGATDNLMDYNNGTTLCKYQWDHVHDPQRVIGLFEDDAAGQSIAVASLACINNEVIAKLKGTVFYDPQGHPIDIGANAPYAFFTQQEEDVALRGKLSAFTVGGVLYTVYYFTNTLKFAGYAPAGKSFNDYKEFKKVMYVAKAGTAASAQEIRISENCDYTIWQNGQSTGPSAKLLDCKCNGLSNSKPQVGGDGKGTVEGFYDYHKANVKIDSAILLRVKNLMARMGDDFYKKYMPGAEEVELTNENLLAMEKSLQHFIDLQNSFFGEVSFAAFEKLIAFLKLCYEDYKKQLADKDTHDIVPRCIWENVSVPVPLYYSAADLAFNAGIIDGAWGMLVGIKDLLNFVDCWTPVSLRFWFDDDCADTRGKTVDFFKAMGGLVSGEGKKLEAFKSTVSTQFSNYIGSLSGFEPKNRHEQGKLVFDIGSLFIGAGEANLVAKGAAITERTALLMEKVAVLMSKIKVPAVIKMIPKKLSNATASTAFVLTMSTGAVSTELATVIPKAANTLEYVIGLTDNAASTATKVAEATAAAEKEIAVIEAAVKTAEAAEKATIKIADNAGKITELGNGVVVTTETSNYVILSIKLGQENIQHVKAIEKTTMAVVLLGVLVGKPGEEPKATCTFCNVPASCGCFEGLSVRYASHANTIKEICQGNPVNGLTICERLAAAPMLFTEEFLADMSKTSADVNHISKFKNSLSVNLIDAWDLIRTYEQPLRRTNMPLLRKVVSQQDNTTLLQRLGGLNGLGTIIAKNKRAPFKGCTTCGSFTYLHDIDDYLADVEDFANRYSRTTGFNEVVGSAGMKNGSVAQVEGTAFMLRVLHSNPTLQTQIVGFEQSVEAVSDDGTTNTRYADISKVNNVIVECKSWSPSGLSFTHFVQGEGSYGQFLTYLRASTSLSGLEYWFDGRKGGATSAVVKGKFQQVFNAKRSELWDIIQTKPSMLAAIGNPVDEAAFQLVINDLTSNLYSFIKIK
jgi:hypothetical protein